MTEGSPRRDPFEVLGVSPKASPEEIQEAYLLLVATYGEGSYAAYPILSKEKRKAVLREIEEAYQTLKTQPSEAPPPPVETPRLEPTMSVSPARDESGWDRLRQALATLWRRGSQSPAGARDADQDRRLAGEYRLSPGRYLRNVRNQKKLSLEEISSQTNIQIQYLRALEEERYEELPTGVYRRLMLSAYAKCLGLEPQALVKDLPDD